MLEDVKELAAENEKLEAKVVEVASAQNDAMQANYDYTNSKSIGVVCIYRLLIKIFTTINCLQKLFRRKFY